MLPRFFTEEYSIGNIFEVNSFDEIWYSEKAINLRKKILSDDYSLCKIDRCDKNFKNNIEYVEKPPYPKFVRFSYDNTCNLTCIYCRDIIHHIENETRWNEYIEKMFLPLIKNCELITVSTIGDVCSSLHSQKLIKKAVEVNPNVKFDILTNGLLCTENFVKNWV